MVSNGTVRCYPILLSSRSLTGGECRVPSRAVPSRAEHVLLVVQPHIKSRARRPGAGGQAQAPQGPRAWLTLLAPPDSFRGTLPAAWFVGSTRSALLRHFGREILQSVKMIALGILFRIESAFGTATGVYCVLSTLRW